MSWDKRSNSYNSHTHSKLNITQSWFSLKLLTERHIQYQVCFEESVRPRGHKVSSGIADQLYFNYDMAPGGDSHIKGKQMLTIP